MLLEHTQIDMGELLALVVQLDHIVHLQINHQFFDHSELSHLVQQIDALLVLMDINVQVEKQQQTQQVKDVQMDIFVILEEN